MIELIVNPELEQTKPYYNNYVSQVRYITDSRKDDSVVKHSLDKDKIYHSNIIEYYQLCWNHHMGVIIEPTMIWHTILHQISVIINENSEKYRSLFTDSDKKKEVSIPTSDPQLINVNDIVERLKDLVPTDIEPFLLNFSTTTPMGQMAVNTAFCEAVSPYYDYSMFMCGIPKIKILGEDWEWIDLKKQLRRIAALLDIEKYANQVEQVLDAIIIPNGEYLSRIFSRQREGSGSVLMIDGWLRHLFEDNSVRKISNYGTVISKINYKNISTGEYFNLFVGLNQSVEEDGYLVPDFGYVVERI